jgi:integrase
MSKSINTDRECQAAKPKENGGRSDHPITNSPGLQLRVSLKTTPSSERKSVSKTWSLLYRRPGDGKLTRMTLGEYPAMSLAEAKQKAGRIRVDVRDGVNPAAKLQAVKEAITFEELCNQWLKRHAKVKKRSWPEDLRNLQLNWLGDPDKPKTRRAKLGSQKAELITTDDVMRVINAIYDRPAPIQANLNLALVRSIFNWGKKQRLVKENPAAGLPMPAPAKKRKRTLEGAEVLQFWKDVDVARMTKPLRLSLKLALVTGQRINEICEARQREFDFNKKLWSIPGTRMVERTKRKKEGGTKNKSDHVIPLTELAISLLQEALELAGDSEWLFPSPTGVGPIGEKAASRAWRRARNRSKDDEKAIKLKDIRVHDLRRTFATIAGESEEEMSDFDIGLVTNHASARGKVVGDVYNQAKYLRKKRKVLEIVERCILEIIDKGSTTSDAGLKGQQQVAA